MDEFRVKIADLLNTYTIKEGKKVSKLDTEGEELKRAWFKHILFSLEKMNDIIEMRNQEAKQLERRIVDLEKRLAEIEKHECKCSGSKKPTV